MTIPRLLSERYELGETLGYGGMSEVRGGRDVRLSRDVAIKVLRADLARDPQFQLRFRREAQNAAGLNHPAIVAVYDTGETDGEFGTLPYIVMEYVDGQTLREIIRDTGPLTRQRVLEVMADVCAALDFSHRHGIIHRDVKPGNVMITRGGAVKVMDFGIARALGEGQNMTQTAAVIGTAHYLSPEQARGEAVDARSDVYAAGCVLFELLTGERPFEGDSPVAVAYQHVRVDPRRPSEVNGEVGPELDSIVLKTLSKNPANRYQSAAEMRTDLVRVLRGQRPQAPQVMSEDERTAMLGTGRSAGGVSGRHAPLAAWYTPRGRKPVDRAAVLRGLGAAAVVALFVFVATRLFGGPGPPEQVTVSDVVNQVQEAARGQLIDQGLKPNIRSVSSPDVPSVPAGQVIRTEPMAGSQVAKGSQIDLYISRGPAQVAVPELAGKSQAEAQQALLVANLTLSSTPTFVPTLDPAQDGRVIGQSPKAGTNVSGQSPVTLTIGQTQPSVVMPTDIIGMREERAYSRLENLGLKVRTENVDGQGRPGTVSNTSPGPGRNVAVNGTVVLQVSKGNRAGMPDLVELTERDAKERLEDAGVRSSKVKVTRRSTDDRREDGRVVGQTPSPGSDVADDAKVTITLGDY